MTSIATKDCIPKMHNEPLPLYHQTKTRVESSTANESFSDHGPQYFLLRGQAPIANELIIYDTQSSHMQNNWFIPIY